VLVADRGSGGRRGRRLGTRPRRGGGLSWALLAGVALGCGSSPAPTFIDVTVDVDPGLDVDRVTMTASAPGKANFAQDFAPGLEIHTSFQPTGLADGARIRLEARGTKNVSPIVLARVTSPSASASTWRPRCT
jgi:hypothetical protein